MALPDEGRLVRNVEYKTRGTGKKTGYQSALQLTNAEEYRLKPGPDEGPQRLQLPLGGQR
jgi:hypothetical protein